MFQKGDYVICGNNGICYVQDITTLNISGFDNKRKYYLLKPVFHSSSTVYIPLDAAEKSIRHAASLQEAQELIQSIPDIPLIPLPDEKALERTYKEYIHEGSREAWVRLIKTIYLRKEKRMMKGCKATAIDSRYLRQAEDFLYGELSIALGIPRDEVPGYITGLIHGQQETAPSTV